MNNQKTSWFAECNHCGKLLPLAPISRQNIRIHIQAHENARRKMAEALLGYSAKGPSLTDDNLRTHYKVIEQKTD